MKAQPSLFGAPEAEAAPPSPSRRQARRDPRPNPPPQDAPLAPRPPPADLNLVAWLQAQLDGREPLQTRPRGAHPYRAVRHLAVLPRLAAGTHPSAPGLAEYIESHLAEVRQALAGDVPRWLMERYRSRAHEAHVAELAREARRRRRGT